MPTFASTANNAQSVLATPYTAGSGTMTLASGYGAILANQIANAGFPAVSSTNPLRYTIISQNALNIYGNITNIGLLAIYEATSLTGNVLGGVTVQEGTKDQNFITNDIFVVFMTAGQLQVLQNAIENAVVSVGGNTGVVTVAQLVTSGLAPLASPTFTGTVTAGLINGTITDGGGQVFNVLHYGAVGNGVADDTAAIQAAITAATASNAGGCVFCPPGKTFKLTSQLVCDSTISLRIEGQSYPEGLGTTTAQATFVFTQSGSAALISAKNSQGFNCYGLRIMYTSTSFTGAMIDLSNVDSGNDTQHALIERCHLQGVNSSTVNAAYGIKLCQTVTSAVRDNQFSYMQVGIYGVNIAGYSNSITITGNFFSSTVGAGIQNAGQQWLIGWNTCEGLVSGSGMLYQDTSTYNPYGPVTFLANWCGDGSGGASPWIYYTGNMLSVLGNYFASPGGSQPCISLGSTHSEMQGVVISGNSFEGTWAVKTAGSQSGGYGVITGFIFMGNHATGGEVSDTNLLYNPTYIGNDGLNTTFSYPFNIGTNFSIQQIQAAPTAGANGQCLIGRTFSVPGSTNAAFTFWTQNNGGGTSAPFEWWTGDGTSSLAMRLSYQQITLPVNLAHTGTKAGFYNANVVTQPTAHTVTSGYVAGTGTAVTIDGTFTGGTGSTAYTIADVVAALKNLGLITS